MTTRLPTQLPAHVDNAPSRLKAARYPQANNCVDNRFHASYTKITTLPVPLLVAPLLARGVASPEDWLVVVLLINFSFK